MDEDVDKKGVVDEGNKGEDVTVSSILLANIAKNMAIDPIVAGKNLASLTKLLTPLLPRRLQLHHHQT